MVNLKRSRIPAPRWLQAEFAVNRAHGPAEGARLDGQRNAVAGRTVCYREHVDTAAGQRRENPRGDARGAANLSADRGDEPDFLGRFQHEAVSLCAMG